MLNALAYLINYARVDVTLWNILICEHGRFMQLFKHLWLMIICVVALLACNSGSIVNNHSSEAIQIQSVFPINGDTNVGISSPVIARF